MMLVRRSSCRSCGRRGLVVMVVMVVMVVVVVVVVAAVVAVAASAVRSGFRSKLSSVIAQTSCKRCCKSLNLKPEALTGS